MKRIGSCLFMLSLSGVGCITFPNMDNAKNKTVALAPPTVVTASRKPVDPVRGDQISDVNAWEKAAALTEELDRDAQGEMPVTPERKSTK